MSKIAISSKFKLNRMQISNFPAHCASVVAFTCTKSDDKHCVLNDLDFWVVCRSNYCWEMPWKKNMNNFIFLCSLTLLIAGKSEAWAEFQPPKIHPATPGDYVVYQAGQTATFSCKGTLTVLYFYIS